MIIFVLYTKAPSVCVFVSPVQLYSECIPFFCIGYCFCLPIIIIMFAVYAAGIQFDRESKVSVDR